MTNNNLKLQPFGRAAINYIDNSNAFLNIAVGSIRSGKTVAAIFRFLCFMGESNYKNFAMAGKTINSLRRNVVDPFLEILDAFGINYRYKKFEQEIITDTKTIALFGIDKIGSEDRIKGFTCAGSLIDEITVMDPDGVRMLISRNSYPGAKIFATCNPGNPNNFIYTEYVNNKELLKTGRCRVFNFLLDDNPSLSNEYKENIKNMYAPGSVFYKRNILNQWVSGQGLIYDSFTDDNILHGDINYDDYYKIGVGHDYGVSTTNCYSVIGITEKNGQKEYHLLYEKYFNAETEGHTQTDMERLNDLIQLQDELHLNQIHTVRFSHDAASLVALAEKEKHKTGRLKMKIKTFRPDTLECITKISNLLNENKFKIHESCTETIKQIRGYEWDTKASAKGIDRPIKKDDHLLDSMRAPIITDLEANNMVGGVVAW